MNPSPDSPSAPPTDSVSPAALKNAGGWLMGVGLGAMFLALVQGLLTGPWALRTLMTDSRFAILEPVSARTEMLVLVAVVLANAVMAWGGHALRHTRDYPVAVGGALLACIPLFPSLYLTPLALPVGVWALSLLLRPEVRARFEPTAPAAERPSSPP